MHGSPSPTPETAFFSYEAMFQRMMDVSDCQTTAELAEELGVYESVLLEIQRDKKMPYHILGFCLDFFHATPL